MPTRWGRLRWRFAHLIAPADFVPVPSDFNEKKAWLLTRLGERSWFWVSPTEVTISVDNTINGTRTVIAEAKAG